MPSTVKGIKYFTLLEAAKMLSTTDSTLRKKIKAGLVRAHQLNGLTCITEIELYRLQDENSIRRSAPNFKP